MPISEARLQFLQSQNRKGKGLWIDEVNELIAAIRELNYMRLRREAPMSISEPELEDIESRVSLGAGPRIGYVFQLRQDIGKLIAAVRELQQSVPGPLVEPAANAPDGYYWCGRYEALKQSAASPSEAQIEAAAREIARWLNWKRQHPRGVEDQNAVSIIGILRRCLSPDPEPG